MKIRQSQAIELATKSATCKRTARGRWFVTLVAEFAMPAAKVSIRQDQAVGFDMVLEPPSFLVGSDGGAVRAPRHYRARERKLRRASGVCRARQGSRNRAKARRPSAKLCSECGYKNDELSLSDREWTVPGVAATTCGTGTLPKT